MKTTFFFAALALSFLSVAPASATETTCLQANGAIVTSDRCHESPATHEFKGGTPSPKKEHEQPPCNHEFHGYK